MISTRSTRSNSITFIKSIFQMWFLSYGKNVRVRRRTLLTLTFIPRTFYEICIDIGPFTLVNFNHCSDKFHVFMMVIHHYTNLIRDFCGNIRFGAPWALKIFFFKTSVNICLLKGSNQIDRFPKTFTIL